MQSRELKDRIAGDRSINIFDVFAMLYSYFEPRFGKGGLDLETNYGRISTESLRVESTVLPSVVRALEPLDPGSQTLLTLAISNQSDEHELEMRLYAILMAIDNAYGSMSARSMNIGNFSLVGQKLNLANDLGLVFPKSTSQLRRLTHNGGKALRTGADKGEYLRDHVHNLVCVRVPEGYNLNFGAMDASTSLCFPSELAGHKIAFVPLIDEIGTLQVVSRDSADLGIRFFHFEGLSNEEDVAERAALFVSTASQMGAVMVLFPELCVTEGVRQKISKGLRNHAFPNVKMVVAGSFHERRGEYWWNVAHVLGPDGQSLWQQRKMQPFTLKTYEAKLVPSLAQMSDKDSHEDIAVVPKELVVRDTPLGRMAVLICQDLLLSDPHRYMLFDLKVDLIVVPAMSISLDENFRLAAEEFATFCNTTTLVCNCCALTREAVHSKGRSSPISVSFACRPWHEPFWYLGCDLHNGEGTSCASRSGCKPLTIELGSWPQGPTGKASNPA